MSTAATTATRTVGNFIDGEERDAASGATFEKLAPATGEVRSVVSRSAAEDVEQAVGAATEAQRDWARRTPVERGTILRKIAALLERDQDEVAEVVAGETGKAPAEAAGETGGAIEMGYFVAGEGRRLYGKTTTSAVANRQAMILRQPLGVAGLIIAANTPIANVAWKVFPALICGNAAVLKASEDTPETANVFARLAAEAGLPPGVLNIVHGFGDEAGQPLVEHPGVAIVSFTGSTQVGRMIARVAGERLAKVCLELGGKNPLVVCDDADLERAADAAALSAYSNAGQRCAAGSRLIVFDSVYDRFVELMLERTRAQRVGPTDDDDFGPVINEGQLEQMVAGVERGKADGARVLAGGERLTDSDHEGGFYMAPTLIEGAASDSEIACKELFGPIATLQRVAGFEEAVAEANNSAYGLTAAIWTASVHRGQEFLARISSGVASVNGPTYGSEPHMPFGGLRDSGTGWREAGTEAIDVYSDLKTVYVNHDPERVDNAPNAVALIPARAGSQRLPGKNVRELGGHPLIAYSIAGARESELFDAVVVSTDSPEIAAVARHYGAEVPWLRPPEMGSSTSPDIEWLRWTLNELASEGRTFDLFSILRPTSPFRLGSAIRQAWDQLLAQGDEADSIRAVELCKQHPGKMWVVDGTNMKPLLEQGEGTPMHSRQYADLPPVYIQNSSLEIAWTRVALEGDTIAGERVLAFLSDPATGFTIDYPEDWDAAERMLAAGEATLPEVQEEPVATEAAT